jgi:serine/threonine-protein kinase
MGGMGAVMSATHLTLGQRVALKFLLRDVMQKDAKSTERFLREARALVTVDSEHVVRVQDVGVLDNGVGYMLMELLHGQDLAQVLAAQGPLPPSFAVDCVLEALDALGAAHAVGIVHRDIKPSNLFLVRRADGSERVKVLDFGVAKARAAEGSDGSLHLTKSGTIVGSPLYMSPEQVRSSKDVDERSDLWSVGVVLYELLVGRPPFDGETFGAVCVAIVSDPLPSIRSVRPDVPPALEAVVARALRKDRTERFASAKEMASALAPFASETGRLAVLGRGRSSRVDGRMPTSGSAVSGAEGTGAASYPQGEKSVSAAQAVPLGFYATQSAAAGAVREASRSRTPRVALVAVGVALVGVGIGIAWVGGARSSSLSTSSESSAASTRMLAKSAPPVAELPPDPVAPSSTAAVEPPAAADFPAASAPPSAPLESPSAAVNPPPPHSAALPPTPPVVHAPSPSSAPAPEAKNPDTKPHASASPPRRPPAVKEADLLMDRH